MTTLGRMAEIVEARAGGTPPGENSAVHPGPGAVVAEFNARLLAGGADPELLFPENPAPERRPDESRRLLEERFLMVEEGSVHAASSSGIRISGWGVPWRPSRISACRFPRAL